MDKVLKRPFPRVELARAFMLVGSGVLLASFVLSKLGRAPFETWFYLFAWCRMTAARTSRRASRSRV
jgi:multisubunit Na+/H+ antiporter MnhB subunit